MKGLGLVETLVAVAISIVVIVSLVSLSSYTLRSSQESKDLQIASSLAQSQIERVRAIRDTISWSQPSTGFYAQILNCINSDPCSATNGLTIDNTFNLPSPLSPGQYYAYFYATNADAGNTTLSASPISQTVRIHVEVVWAGGGSTYNFTDLSNWRSN